MINFILNIFSEYYIDFFFLKKKKKFIKNIFKYIKISHKIYIYIKRFYKKKIFIKI